MKSHSGIHVAVRPDTDQRQLHNIAADGLTALCLLAGSSLSICNCFPAITAPWWALFSGMLLLFALLQALQFSPIGKWVPLAVLALTAALCTIFYQQVLSGVAALGNDILTSLSALDGKIHLDIAAASQASSLWGVIPFAVLIVVLLHWTTQMGSMLFMLPVLLCSYSAVLTGFVPVDAGFVLLCMATILLFMRAAAAKTKLQGSAGIPSWIAVVAFCTAISIGIGCVVGSSARKTAQWDRTIHSALYDSDANSMPEGNLENLSSWNKNDTPALKITMTAPQKMYLRGQIYETYSATAWSPLDAAERAEYEDLFYWLHQSNFYGQGQIGVATNLATAVQPEEMTIEILSACKAHGYYPYAIVGNTAFPADRIGDTALPATSVLQYYTGSVPQWYETQFSLASNQDAESILAYLAAEEAYEKYITEVDLQLTDESFSVLNRQLKDMEKPNTLSQIRTFIREFLSENLVYDERVQTLNGEEDFLHYTLERSGSGYSVHYATAAVLMLRYFGVPARYVEGYFLSAAEAERYQAGESIVLTEKHAHAWAEYYLPGVGFIPFEVTPGYMDDEELQIGGDINQDEPTYNPDHLDYAEVEQPERIEDPRQDRFAFSTKASYLWYLVAVITIVCMAILLLKRRRLGRALAAIEGASNREAIAMRYGYAERLVMTLQDPHIDGAEQAALLNCEALFSNHEMTDLQRHEMDEYAQRVLQACKNEWTIWKKLRYWLWECLY